MAKMKNRINDYIDSVISGDVKLTIPIFDDDRIAIGSLQPITRFHLRDYDLMCLLSEWRNQNSDKFITRFNATPERTANWLDKVVFPSQDQMLFLVKDRLEKLVGHTGFKNLSYTSALSDNTVRGNRAEHPRIFVFAIRGLIGWLFDIADIKKVEGEVFADNIPALMMNKQVGFKLIEKVILEEVQEGNTAVLKLANGGSEKNTKILHRLHIERSDF